VGELNALAGETDDRSACNGAMSARSRLKTKNAASNNTGGAASNDFALNSQGVIDALSSTSELLL
jgi:hypothetical protein